MYRKALDLISTDREMAESVMLRYCRYMCDANMYVCVPHLVKEPARVVQSLLYSHPCRLVSHCPEQPRLAEPRRNV